MAHREVGQFRVAREQDKAAVRAVIVAVVVQPQFEAERRSDGHRTAEAAQDFGIGTHPSRIGVEPERVGAHTRNARPRRIADEAAGPGRFTILRVVERPRPKAAAQVRAIGPATAVVVGAILLSVRPAARGFAKDTDHVGAHTQGDVRNRPGRCGGDRSRGPGQGVGPAQVAGGYGAGRARQRVRGDAVGHGGAARWSRDRQARAADCHLEIQPAVVGHNRFFAICGRNRIAHQGPLGKCAQVRIVPGAAAGAPLRIQRHGIGGPRAAIRADNDRHARHAAGRADFRVHIQLRRKCRCAVFGIILRAANPQAALQALCNRKAVVLPVVVVQRFGVFLTLDLDEILHGRAD